MLLKPLKPFIGIYFKMPLVCSELIAYPSPSVEAKLGDNFQSSASPLHAKQDASPPKAKHVPERTQLSRRAYSFLCAQNCFVNPLSAPSLMIFSLAWLCFFAEGHASREAAALTHISTHRSQLSRFSTNIHRSCERQDGIYLHQIL